MLFIRADIDLTVEPVRNKHGEPRQFRISLTADMFLRITQEGSDTNVLTVAPDSTTQARVYVVARLQDPASFAASTDLRLWGEDVESGERARRDNVFNGRVQ